MASDRQIAANRLNSKKSTGPRTDQGKRSSRRNAIRHGLTAETIINVIEDPADYEAFEKAIKRGYEPKTGMERELLARLASLLWRLRRATAIESGLFQIRINDSHEGNVRPHVTTALSNEKLRVFYDLIPPNDVPKPTATAHRQGHDGPAGISQSNQSPNERSRIDLVRTFQRLARLDHDVFERLGRYETSLWRQAAQTLVLLNLLNHQRRTVRRTSNKFHRSHILRSRFFPERFCK